MLEAEFVDRSVALASKAFVSFFPLVIVVAAFVPHDVRVSIFSTLTHRLGIQGHALAIAKESFATADQIRQAKGVLGLILTFFFASSFTTALQRVYLRAWRRPPAKKVGSYTRGPAWLAVMIGFMAMMGAMRGLLGDGPGHRTLHPLLASSRFPRCGRSLPGSCWRVRCGGGCWCRRG